jgi:hypothetical protein
MEPEYPYETLQIGDRTINLQFSIKTQLEIEKTARKEIWDTPGPMSLDVLISNLSMITVRLYLLRKALKHPESGGEPKEAEELYEQYLDKAHPDDGTRLKDFCEKMAMAVTLSQGFDGKKASVRMEEEKKEKASGPGKTSSDSEKASLD